MANKLEEQVKMFFKFPLWKRWLVYSGILLLMLGGWAYFFLVPLLDTKDRIEANLVQLDRDITRFRVIAANLNKVKKDLSFYEKQFFIAKNLLPEDAKALEKVLASFEKMGLEKGIEFAYFRPLSETKYDFYAARLVNIRVLGSFHNIVSYLDELSRLNRLVSLRSVKFSPQGPQGQVSRLSVDCTLEVYRALTEAEIKAQAEQAKNEAKKKRRK
ncbi:MAG: Tfp pilus assembly protein PilO-like protein [Desulfonauticus sp. 38_4375]|nr:MAG: Tfp pilus assembly protein PilO-like protein [Desulfonauticus sp. 38_4375]